MPVVTDSCGYIVCEVIDKMETATHTVFLGEVKGAELFGNRDAMTYAYYHKVIKGKSPKNAPTYIPEEEIFIQKFEEIQEKTEEQSDENIDELLEEYNNEQNETDSK